jgi:acyl-CoA dehydrogenase
VNGMMGRVDTSRTADEDLSALLAEQADRLFLRHVTKECLSAADHGAWLGEVWVAVEEAGLPRALVAEALGGVDLAPLQALALIRRSAYYCLPLPLAETMLALALWAQASGSVVEGPVTLAPTRASDAVRLSQSGAGFCLEGTAVRVPWARNTGHVLVHAEGPDGFGQLALVPTAGLRIEHGRNLANEPRDTVIFEGLALDGARVRPAPPSCAGGFLDLGAALRAMQMVGAMERSLNYSLDYANERIQFGRPIGRFQAVQHMLADAAGHFAAAAAAAENAATVWGEETFGLAAALAKSRVGEAAGRVAAICHQVHGAIGFTQEHPLHFSTRRLWSWRDEFGSDAVWEERIGRWVCAEGGEGLWDLIVRVTGGACSERPV